uniref:t-SNARE coiled-coil homology domain-containing protein n=1 Tax=Panagrolaimus sp. PS1159 TaxID=55785 RepID=A0AC35FJQ2_9BILA
MSNPFDSNEVRSYTTGSSKPKDEINHYERELDKVYQESLDSTQRSVQHQREKLERTEKNLDEIHQTTFETQRNLNDIKSFFGGFFKNKFSRGPKEPSVHIPPSKCDNKLNSHLNSSSSSSSASAVKSPSLSAGSRKTVQGTHYEEMDNKIDEDLGLMSSKLESLRELGKVLGNVVDDQNEMINRIQIKTLQNDGILLLQNKQMRKLI